MKRELTNEESLELFADLVEPVGEILFDEEVRKALSENKALKAIKLAIKRHKRRIIEALALIDGVPVEDYKVNVLTLPMKLMEFVNKPEFQELFTSAGQTNAVDVSGSATENTGDGAV